MHRQILVTLCIGLLTLVFGSPAIGEGLSRDQGDIIISELRQIRSLLEKQQKGEAAPAAPAVPERVSLKIGREFALGREDAPVVMVEYTDYQCPFCSQFHTVTYPALKRDFIDTGKLRYISRDYPLDFHPHALKAAQAAQCAGEQDKFWQMKDALMKNHAQLNPELITSLARDMSVRMPAFQACMDEGKHLSEIKAGIAVAATVGINGTPSFIIGRMSGDTLTGFRIVGAQPYAEFEKLIKQVASGEKK